VRIESTAGRRWSALVLLGALAIAAALSISWVIATRRANPQPASESNPPAADAARATSSSSSPSVQSDQPADASTVEPVALTSEPTLTVTWHLDDSRVVSKGERIPGPDGEVLQGVVVESRASTSAVDTVAYVFRATYTVTPGPAGERVSGSWSLAPAGSRAQRHAPGVTRGIFEGPASAEDAFGWSVPMRILAAPAQFAGGTVEGQFEGNTRFEGQLVLPRRQSAAALAVRN